MAILLNKEYKFSPIFVELKILNIDREGWLSFHLILTTGNKPQQIIASCSGLFSSKDYDILITNLKKISKRKVQSFEFIPIEPSFILRAKDLKNNQIEFNWIIDQGITENNYSTDTGIGVLIITMLKDVESFLNNLTEEVKKIKPKIPFKYIKNKSSMYDNTQHYHLGYYESEYDFEAIALKVLDQNLWHVFFPFNTYNLQIPEALKNAPSEEEFGILIITSKNKETLEKKFVKWFEKEILPKISKNN